MLISSGHEKLNTRPRGSAAQNNASEKCDFTNAPTDRNENIAPRRA